MGGRGGTLDAPLEEGLAALTAPHPVVVPGRVVLAHRAEVHVSAPPGPAQRPLLLPLPRHLIGRQQRSEGMETEVGKNQSPDFFLSMVKSRLFQQLFLEFENMMQYSAFLSKKHIVTENFEFPP